jgi:hypothetical protein
MRNRWLLRSVVPSFIIASVLASGIAMTGSDQVQTAIQADCDTKRTAQATRVANLEKMASKTENVTVDGKPAVRYYLPMVATERRGNVIKYELALYHQDVLAFAKSPEWYNSANGRYYWYQANTWVDHQISDPCSGQDQYLYGFNAGCWRRLGTDEVRNYCTWNSYVGLQTSVSGGEGTFGAPWGYRKVYRNGTPTQVCGSSGNPHSITDGSVAIRTWLWLDVAFYSDSFQWLHDASARKTVSRGMFAADHNFYSFVGTGTFLDAGTPPSRIGSEVC